jgi:hypothetical protein
LRGGGGGGAAAVDGGVQAMATTTYSPSARTTVSTSRQLSRREAHARTSAVRMARPLSLMLLLLLLLLLDATMSK